MPLTWLIWLMTRTAHPYGGSYVELLREFMFEDEEDWLFARPVVQATPEEIAEFEREKATR